MTGLSALVSHPPPCVCLVNVGTRGMKKGKKCSALHIVIIFHRIALHRNSKLWHTARSVEKRLFRESEEGGWVNGRACRRKLVKKKANGHFRFSL